MALEAGETGNQRNRSAVTWACGPGGTAERVAALGEETVRIVSELL